MASALERWPWIFGAREGKLLGALGDELLRAALGLALHLDLVSGDGTSVVPDYAVAVEFELDAEGDVVALNFAVGNCDFRALRTGHGTGEFGAIRLEVVNDFAGLAI